MTELLNDKVTKLRNNITTEYRCLEVRTYSADVVVRIALHHILKPSFQDVGVVHDLTSFSAPLGLENSGRRKS
jgi:hypothetical protein